MPETRLPDIQTLRLADMPSLDSWLSHTAIHEAGHAIVTAAYRWPVEYASLNEGDGGGFCKVEFPERISSSAVSLRRVISVQLAGMAAQALMTGVGEDLRREIAAGSSTDTIRAFRLAAMLVSKEQRLDLIDSMGARAQHLLRRHYRALFWLAAELTEQRRISGDRIRDVVKHCRTLPPLRPLQFGLLVRERPAA
jgi:ATP-dependent Zn protease